MLGASMMDIYEESQQVKEQPTTTQPSLVLTEGQDKGMTILIVLHNMYTQPHYKRGGSNTHCMHTHAPASTEQTLTFSKQ